MEEIFNKIRKYGISGVLDYFIYNVIKTHWHSIHYLKSSLNYEQISNKLDYFDFKVQELNYEDFLLGDPNEFTPRKLKIIKERLYDNSYRCYGFIDNNTLAYSTWISLKKIGIPIVKESINLLDNEGFLEDSYCHPLYRGKGLHSKFNLYRMMKIHKLGKKNCLVFVFKGNVAALKVQQKYGFIDLGYFRVGKILGFTFNTLNKKKMDILFELYNN
ncbi:MAG: hypothetical protein CMC98_03095 [Flavobacteriales bacterium]|nr:hypothetical protein [Flavobacteriales bacterium]